MRFKKGGGSIGIWEGLLLAALLTALSFRAFGQTVNSIPGWRVESKTGAATRYHNFLVADRGDIVLKMDSVGRIELLDTTKAIRQLIELLTSLQKQYQELNVKHAALKEKVLIFLNKEDW